MTKKDLEDLDKVLSFDNIGKREAKFCLEFYNRMTGGNHRSCPTCGSQIRRLFKLINEWIDDNKELIKESREKHRDDIEEEGDR